MLTAWLDKLDLEYLQALAERDGTREELQKLLEEARRIRSRLYTNRGGPPS